MNFQEHFKNNSQNVVFFKNNFRAKKFKNNSRNSRNSRMGDPGNNDNAERNGKQIRPKNTNTMDLKNFGNSD